MMVSCGTSGSFGLGLLLIVIPLGCGLTITVFSMMLTCHSLEAGAKVDPKHLADDIIRSLLYTAIAIPVATIGLVGVVLGLFPRGQE